MSRLGLGWEWGWVGSGAGSEWVGESGWGGVRGFWFRRRSGLGRSGVGDWWLRESSLGGSSSMESMGGEFSRLNSD